MAQTLKNVPQQYLKPRGAYVLIRQYNTTQTEAGLHLPEVAQMIVQVAVKVGPEVEDVREGDVVIIKDHSSITYVPEIEGPCALVPEGAIAGVIRGYDWRKTAMEAIVSAPS